MICLPVPNREQAVLDELHRLACSASEPDLDVSFLHQKHFVEPAHSVEAERANCAGPQTRGLVGHAVSAEER